MSTVFQIILCAGLLTLCLESSGQVSSTEPRNWRSSTSVLHDLDVGRALALSHNGPEIIRQELLDTNTIRLIAKYAGLTEAELSTIQVAPNAESVELYQLGTSEKAFNVLSEELRNYVRTRRDGHTRAFVLEALTKHVQPSAIQDPDLRALAINQPLLPLSWLRKAESGTSTNKGGTLVSRTTSIKIENGKAVTNETAHVPRADEVCRWVSYTVVDGEVGWGYFVMSQADGSLDYVHVSRCDPKEYDPKYRKLIKEVESEVEAEIKKKGIYEKLGSVHTFWHLKKEKLKARGVEWRSPSELNPGVMFD